MAVWLLGDQRAPPEAILRTIWMGTGIEHYVKQNRRNELDIAAATTKLCGEEFKLREAQAETLRAKEETRAALDLAASLLVNGAVEANAEQSPSLAMCNWQWNNAATKLERQKVFVSIAQAHVRLTSRTEQVECAR